MLLLLLNGFHCHVLPLVPIYLTARERKYKKVRGGKKQICKKKAEVGRLAKKRMICGMQKQIYIENTKKINKYCTNHTSISELKLNITCLPQFDKHMY